MNSLIISFKKRIKPVLPAKLLAFYEVYRWEYPLKDRSQVILFAKDGVLPGYPKKVDPGELDSTRLDKVDVTLISAVKNEADNAASWLETLALQTRPPDEVVLVDGGSTDGTLDILRETSCDKPYPIRILEAPQSNISEARNMAIQAASNPVIACTDFGCVLEPTWLEKLIRPMEADEQIELSGGYYRVVGETILDKLAAHYLGIQINAVDPQSFLPSSRSLAFTKNIWEAAGHYPEWLTDAGEDTLFDYHLKSQPAVWAFVPDAVVLWQAPSNLGKLLRTYVRYARGDGETGINARQYWYRTVLSAKSIFRTFLVVLISAIFVYLLGEWSLPLLGIGMIYLIIRFIRHNLARARNLNLPFYPITLIDELVGFAQVYGFTQGVLRRPLVRRRKIRYYRERLKDILQEHPEPKRLIIYPPTHDWGFMFQRPHQMARAFAKEGVLFFYGTANELSDSVYGFKKVEPNLYVFHAPLDTFSEIEAPLVYIGSPWHRDKLINFARPRVIYDHYDDLEVSGGRIEDHLWLLKNSELVITTSRILLEKVQQIRSDVLFLPNGVDLDFIKIQEPGPGDAAPSDFLEIQRLGKPIIGYSGALAEWFDYDLLKFAARERSDLNFVLIGVDYDGSLSRSNLLREQNVFWLGMKDYDDLFAYVWRFDVAMIPFRVNDITLSTSPIKMYEYMACRKPVVATDIPECRRTPGVLVAENSEVYLQCIKQALEDKHSAEYRATLEQVANQNTWKQRVSKILQRVSTTSSKF